MKTNFYAALCKGAALIAFEMHTQVNDILTFNFFSCLVFFYKNLLFTENLVLQERHDFACVFLFPVDDLLICVFPASIRRSGFV